MESGSYIYIDMKGAEVPEEEPDITGIILVITGAVIAIGLGLIAILGIGTLLKKMSEKRCECVGDPNCPCAP